MRKLIVLAALCLNACEGQRKPDRGVDTSAIADEPMGSMAGTLNIGIDWTRTVRQTPEGGFLLGNPDAEVKLVEFGSMTCPQCAEFSRVAERPLTDSYIKSGRVSFEFRNVVRDPFDVTATLVARCDGARKFFHLTRSLYAAQRGWVSDLQTVPRANMDDLQRLPPAEQFQKIADWAGFRRLAGEHGLSPAEIGTCLSDERTLNKLVAMHEAAASKYNVSSFPAFVLNGSLVPNAKGWSDVEPELKKALNGTSHESGPSNTGDEKQAQCRDLLLEYATDMCVRRIGGTYGVEHDTASTRVPFYQNGCDDMKASRMVDVAAPYAQSELMGVPSLGEIEYACRSKLSVSGGSE